MNEITQEKRGPGRPRLNPLPETVYRQGEVVAQVSTGDQDRRTGADLRTMIYEKIRNSAWVDWDNDTKVEIHSADDAYVYIFPERKGNGDKSRCHAMGIHEFIKKMGW